MHHRGSVWFINDNSIATYGHTNGDTFPITLSSSLPGIEISVTSAAPDNVNPLFLDHATSTLTTNTTLLQVFNILNITCGNYGTRSELVTVNFNILAMGSHAECTQAVILIMTYLSAGHPSPSSAT